MRDFKVSPQYDYCCNPWKILDLGDVWNVKDTSNEELSAKVTVSKEDITIPNVLIAYGSETGTAEAVASSLSKHMKACDPFLCTLNKMVTLDALKDFDHILVICSTFGKGKPPKNAETFFDSDLLGKLNEKTWFAVLALGSSLYPDFCKAGQEVEEKMIEAGAVAKMQIKCVDTAHGNQAEILEWSNLAKKLVLPDSILMAIKAKRDSKRRGKQYAPPTYSMKWSNREDEYQMYSLNQRSKGNLQCLKTEELFGEMHVQSSRRSTRHIEFTLPEEMTYETGDHLSIKPWNSVDMISRFVHCFANELENAAVESGYYGAKLQSDTKVCLAITSEQLNCTQSIAYALQQPFCIELAEDGKIFTHPDQLMTNNSLLQVLREVVDLSFHSKSYLVDLLSTLLSKLDTSSSADTIRFRDHANEVVQQSSCEDGNDTIKELCDKFPTVVDLFEEFGYIFCEPFEGRKEPLIRLADILTLVPKLSSRLYSISSSDIMTPRTVAITVGVVNFHTQAMVRVEGVCSNQLASLQPGDHVEGKVVKSFFRPPTSYTSPLIMIAAGTGLAPFMGFLQEREDHAAQLGLDDFGECHLFFGCRNDDEYLYKDQLVKWENDGIVKLRIAKSRQQQEYPKKRVQDCISEHGEELVALLMSEDRPHVYICGNAGMADSCREEVIEQLKTHGNMSKVAATQMLTSMYIDNRWNLDVWGTIGKSSIDIGMSLSTSMKSFY